MLFGIYSIYDSAIKTWGPPIYARNKGEILRDFGDACNDSKTKWAKHPQDYTLFELGEFDDDKCNFSLLKTPVRLCMALDFVKLPESSLPLKELKDADYSGSPALS